MAKAVGAALESLEQNHAGELLGRQGVYVLHVKAKGAWEDGCRGIVKKASSRSKTEEMAAEEGMGGWSVYGLATTGKVGALA